MGSFEMNISTLDLVIVGLYFIMIFGIGLAVARRTKTGDQLFLAGRSLG